MKNLVFYFLTAYLISWLIWLPLYQKYFGISRMPVLPFHHALGALGPITAGFIFSIRERGSSGANYLLRSMFMPGRNRVYLVIALTGPFVILVLAAWINSFLNSTSINLTGIGVSSEFPRFSFIGFFLYNLISFGYGEEVGWRGYALPVLQKKFNSFWASVILTVGWAVWHIPLFLYRPGYMEMGAGDIFGWWMSLLAGSILFTWLFNKSGKSLLVCAVFHATVDIIFTSNIQGKEITNTAGLLITVWGIITLLVLKKDFFIKR